MSNQNQQAIHALKQAVSSENLNHYDKSHWALSEVKNVLEFIEDSLEHYNYKKASFAPKPLASIVRLVNKEIAYLDDELERNYDNVKEFIDPQDEAIEGVKK